LLGRLHDLAAVSACCCPRSAGGDETEPAVYVAASEELRRAPTLSIAWKRIRRQQFLPLIAAYLEPAAGHAILR